MSHLSADRLWKVPPPPLLPAATMQSNRPAPPPYPDKLTVALLGSNVVAKNKIGNLLLNSADFFNSMEHKLVIGETASVSAINTPDFFDEDCANPDQRIIDFMAFTFPGPDVFLLVVDSKGSTEEAVVAQISKLQENFGEQITEHLVVMLPSLETQHNLKHLREVFNVSVVIVTDNLRSECRAWSSENSFTFDFSNYSKEVVLRRRAALEKKRFNERHDFENPGATVLAGQPASSTFNFVFLGLTGTGKSASANSILSTGNSGKQHMVPFLSRPSSVPITRRCETRFMNRPFWIPVLLVDTPDFFNEEIRIPEEQVRECRKFCVPGHCVLLLVVQLGRFTAGEIGILQRLEEKIGWKIRTQTIVLLTHKDDLKEPLDQYVNLSPPLKSMVEMCGFRYCAFNNKSKDPKQVYELVKKIPNYQGRFPQLEVKKAVDCNMC